VRIFLDTANIEQIRNAAKLGIISGVTTNPSLVSKEGTADYQSVVKEICSIIPGPVSAEVMAEEAPEMIEQVNMTLCFSLNQAILGARAGAAYVSPFVGRLDDAGHDGMQVVKDIVEVFRYYQLPTQVIAASIRHPLHCVTAAKVGAHIATIPYSVLMQMMYHPLTDVGVARFLADWRRVSPS